MDRDVYSLHLYARCQATFRRQSSASCITVQYSSTVCNCMACIASGHLIIWVTTSITQITYTVIISGSSGKSGTGTCYPIYPKKFRVFMLRIRTNVWVIRVRVDRMWVRVMGIGFFAHLYSWINVIKSKFSYRKPLHMRFDPFTLMIFISSTLNMHLNPESHNCATESRLKLRDY
jgi:hypothetical protein